MRNLSPPTHTPRPHARASSGWGEVPLSIHLLPPAFLLPGYAYGLSQRFPAPLKLGRDPSRQIRVSPHLADQLADHVRRGDVASLRVLAQEPV